MAGALDLPKYLKKLYPKYQGVLAIVLIRRQNYASNSKMAKKP